MRGERTSADGPSVRGRRAVGDSDARGEFPWLAVGVAMLVGLALRWPALHQDPWIDEVWSWGLARSREGLLDVFTIRSSNSHALNTLWIRLVGDRDTFFVYRLPSLVAGLACVPLAARIAWRSSRGAAIAAAWVFALAFLGIVFSSEARGYTPLVACSLGMFHSAASWLETGARRWLVASWVCAILGVLAQTLFVLGWAAIAIAVVVQVLRQERSGRARRILWFLSLPLVSYAAWWVVNLRHVVNGGAPNWDFSAVMTRTIAWRTGLPVAGWASIAGGVAFVLVLLDDVRQMVRRGDRAWAVQLALVVLVPVATTAILWDEFLAPRYFLVPLAFWSISFARVVAHGFDRGGVLRALAVVLFLGYSLGNLMHVQGFLRTGRGHVGELVREMATRSKDRTLIVSGNYDFNVGAQIEWHMHAAREPRPIAYVSQGNLPPSGADFFVVDKPRFETPAVQNLRVANHAYRLIATSIHVGPCGSDWAVYERAPE